MTYFRQTVEFTHKRSRMVRLYQLYDTNELVNWYFYIDTTERRALASHTYRALLLCIRAQQPSLFPSSLPTSICAVTICSHKRTEIGLCLP